MIPVSPANVQTHAWKKELQHASLSLSELLAYTGLSPDDFATPLLAAPGFKLKATASYLHKIVPGKPDDPLLLQILPQACEAALTTGFAADPVGDLAASPTAGLIQKYHGRALLVASSNCPVHCRYCFRRHFPYAEHLHDDAALKAIAKDTSIGEVILSGGDPLSLNNENLAEIFTKLEAIAHVHTVRIHSRFASTLPSRFDAGLRALFEQSRLAVVLVNHINHGQEIDDAVVQALAPFKAVATLLNQSVLLRGVNDDAETLAALSKALFAAGVLPYYLHQLDPVQGAAHFAVDDAKAVTLWQHMQRILPGYLVPRLVRELAGKPYKTWLSG